MAWDDTKSPGDTALSSDWNTMVTDQKARIVSGADTVKDKYVDWGTSTDQIHSALMPIGTPTDGALSDGLLDWTTGTKVADAIDDVNEIMSELAPADADSMAGGTLTYTGTTKYTGRLASGAGITYKTGTSSGTSVNYIVSDATFSLFSPSQGTCFNKADEGSLVFFINATEKGTFNLGSLFNTAERAGSQTYPPKTNTLITVTSVRAYNDFSKWQKGNATCAVVAGSCGSGYNYFSLNHSGISTTQTSANFEIFFDTDTNTPAVTTPIIREGNKVTKYLDGVQFYSTGTTFLLDVSGTYLFATTYHDTGSPLGISGFTGVSNTYIPFTNGSVNGVTNPPGAGQTMICSGVVLQCNVNQARSLNSRITITPRDPYGTYSTAQSASQNRMIDNYTSPTSTDKYEYFDDENRRMTSGTYNSIPTTISGPACWATGTTLSNGTSQVYNGTLYYPTINWYSGYLPSQQAGTDYSSFSGKQYFYRAIYDAGNPHSAGTLEFLSLVDADIGESGTGAVNVFIKLPSQTGWLDLGKDYSLATFTGADNDGCQTSQSSNSWSWTCGGFTTANSGYMIMVLVIFNNSSKSIASIREMGW